MAQIERRLAAIMLADIAGYSSLMERSESRTFRRVRNMREELISPIVTRYGGRIIKTTGDGFLAEFTSGTAALLCGIDIQRLNYAREAAFVEDERLHLRIGINLGDIIIDGDDVSGDGVNVAARLEPLAPEDGICISGAVRDQVREDLDVVFEDLGEQQVKNIARPIRAYRINLAGTPAPRIAFSGSNSRNRLIAGCALVVAAIFALGAYYRNWGAPASPTPVNLASDSKDGEFAGVKIASALVVGINNYSNQSSLANAGSDALAVATSLRLRGVQVVLKVDLNQKDLAREVAQFRNQPEGGAVKLFYFAGHGGNINRKNFLYPADAPSNVDLEAGRGLDKLLPVADIYDSTSGKMLVLLDTHGDPVGVPDNVILTFSGSPKNIALDAYHLPDGTMSMQSPYSASIIEMLAGSDENLPSAFLRLSQRVEQKTNGQQIPWVSSSIVGAISWVASGAAK